MNTALITGVGRGIGKALAEKFLAEGWSVVGTIRDKDVLSRNENLKTFTMDMSVPESIARCVSEIGSLRNTYDVLINNAGALFDEEETSVVVDKLRKTLEVNLIGTIDFTERILSLVKDSAHIINISSTAGSLALAGHATELASHFPHHYPAYKISKAGLNMYTRTLATRLESRGVTVSSVHPGWVRTEMGGDEAPFSTQEAAEEIFKIAIRKPESGGFWFKEESVPW